MCHDLHSPGHSYLRAWACRWLQSLQVQDIQQKYIWTQPRSTRRRGENLCLFHHLNQSPGCTFPHSQIFQGPIKLYIWKQTNTHSQKSVFHVAVRGLRCRVYTCWVGGPTQTSAWPQLPFPLPELHIFAHSLGALPECKPQQRQGQERTRANRRVTGFVQDRLRRSKAICCFQLNLSGAAERNASTDLGAAGQVEVDEIVAALPCGQVQKTFVCESIAVGQTQILKAQAVSVRCKKLWRQIICVNEPCTDHSWLFGC